MTAADWRIHWVILRTSIEERFAYRGDFWFGTLVRFLPTVTQVLLWAAIYHAGTDRAIGRVNGYTYSDMVAYFLLAMVARAFSSMPGLASGIAYDIRSGTLRKYLTQPVDMLGYLFWHRVAHKLVYYFVATGPFALVFWLWREHLPPLPSAFQLFGFAAALVMSFLIGFLMEALLGLVAFWFLEVSSLLFIYMMLSFFLSGHMIPLDWFGPFGEAMQYLPFKYLAYTPSAIMLGRFSDAALARELLIEFAWVLGFLVACRVAFHRGVRHYGAFGG